MKLFFNLALIGLLSAGALAQTPQQNGAFSIPLTSNVPGYDFRISPRTTVRCPEWLRKTIALELKDTPSPEAIEDVLKLAEVPTLVDASSRSRLPGGYVTGRSGRGVPMALYGRQVSLSVKNVTVEDALQEIARQAQVDLEFYSLPQGRWRVVVREAELQSANNLFIAGAPQKAIVSPEIARALEQANNDVSELSRSDASVDTRNGGRGGFGGGNLAAKRSSLPVVQSLARPPAPGISERLVTLDVRKKSLRECFDAVLKPTGVSYALEGDFPLTPLRTFAFEDVPLDLALDLMVASGRIGWSAELRDGKPHIKIGRRYAPKPQ
jgi:hypothetical protein